MEGQEKVTPRAEFDVHDENSGDLDHVASSSRDLPVQNQASENVHKPEPGGAVQMEDDGTEARRMPQESEGGAGESSGLQEGELRAEETEGDGADRPVVTGPRLPSVNCPEKIIICIDLASEVNKVPFLQRDGTKHLPIELVKRALSLFVRTKSNISPAHQFALVVLQETAVWLQDFTSDVEDFLNVMFDLTNETQDCESCDLSSLFKTIASQVELPEIEDVEVLPPPYIVRTLFFYGRSAHIPEFTNGREEQLALSSSPYFFFDVFYLHEPPSEDNCCKDIYDVFLDLDKNNTSYIHEVGRNTTQLYNKMAALVAHPLQRPEQIFSSYSLDPEQ
ncbi:BRISC and BRCA1-A complex member 1-like isoform X2 [Diadema setosum]